MICVSVWCYLKQVIKVIWHKTTLPPQMDVSVVFAMWCQCSLPCDATWRIRLNLCFLRPTRIHNQNSKSVGSAISAQLTAECRQIHWCHLGNLNELVLPSARPSPHPKRQIVWFSHLCTAQGRKSLCFRMGGSFPQNCTFSWGDLDPHLNHDSLGQSKPTIQTASRSVQPFLHRWLQSVPIVYNGSPIPPPLKIAHSHLDPT